jgi:hypothetical protein
VRPPEWDRLLSPHLTIGYVVQPFAEDEIETFLQAIREFNEAFEPIVFELTQGEVTAFLDMDHYYPVHKRWDNAAQFDAQTKLLSRLFSASHTASYEMLGDQQRKSGIGCIYFAGERLDHEYCLGTRSAGVLHSALPTDYPKAIRPAFHEHHSELVLCTHGTVVLQYTRSHSPSAEIEETVLHPGEFLVIQPKWPHKISLKPLRLWFESDATAETPSQGAAGFLAVKMGRLSMKAPNEDLRNWKGPHPLIDSWREDVAFLSRIASEPNRCAELSIDPASLKEDRERRAQ